MGSAVSVPAFRGVLIPSALCTWANLSQSLSTWDAYDPGPGGCRPSDQWSEFRAEISGEQSAEIQTVITEGGYLGGGTGGRGARVAYRFSTDTTAPGGVALYPTGGTTGDGDLRGLDAPTVPTDWQMLDTTSGTVSACVIPSTQRIARAWKQGGSTSINVAVYNPYTRTDGAAVVVSRYPSASTDVPAIVCVPGSERLIMYSRDIGGRQVGCYSDDAGATWALYAVDILRSAYTITSPVARHAHISPSTGDFGHWLATNTSLEQFASTNGGSSFTLVATLALVGGTYPADVCQLASGRVLVVLPDTATQFPQVRVLSGPADPVTAYTNVQILAVSCQRVFAWQNPDGAIFVLCIPTAGSAARLVVSRDEGATWSECAHGPIDTTSATYVLGAGDVVPAAGGAYWFGAGLATSHAVCRIGGWSNVVEAEDLRSTGSTDPDARRVGFGYHSASTPATSIVWTAWAAPASMGWTSAGAGTDTLLTGGTYPGTNAIATTANTRTHTFSLGTSAGCDVRAICRVVSGGSVATNQIGLTVILANGTFNKNVQIRLSASSQTLAAYDGTAGTSFGSASWAGYSTLEIRICIRQFTSLGDHHVETFWRPVGETRWRILGTSDALTNGGVLATGSVAWGHHTNVTATSTWSLVAAYAQAAAGNPSDWLIWRGSPCPAPASASDDGHWPVIGALATGTPAPLGDTATAGASFVRGVGGPARFGERFTNAVQYAAGPEKMFPEVSPSPSDPWESATTTTPGLIWNATNARTLGSWSPAVFVENTNLPSISLYYWDGATYQNAGTLDFATGFKSLRYTRTGDTIEVDAGGASGTGTRFLGDGEAVGGTFNFGGGVVREILEQSAGTWTNASTQRIVLRIASTGAEPASGTGGEIWMPRGVLVVHKAAGEVARTRWGLGFPGGIVTASGRIKIGSLMIGGFFPFGRQWSRGYAFDADPNVRITEDERGTTFAAVRGPVRRAWTVAWPDPVLTRQYASADPAPDFLASTTATKAIATDRDVPLLALGMLERLQGGPCVLIRSVPTSDGAQVITDRNLFLYSRMTSPLRVEHVDGPEDRGGWSNRPAGEYLRVSPLQFQEIV